MKRLVAIVLIVLVLALFSLLIGLYPGPDSEYQPLIEEPYSESSTPTIQYRNEPIEDSPGPTLNDSLPPTGGPR